MEKDRKIRELSSVHESDMQKIEDKLCSTRMELDTVKQESVSILVTSLNEIGVRSVSRDMKFCMNFFIKFYSFITNILIRVQFVEKQRGMGEYLKNNVITSYSTFTCTQKSISNRTEKPACKHLSNIFLIFILCFTNWSILRRLDIY